MQNYSLAIPSNPSGQLTSQQIIYHVVMALMISPLSSSLNLRGLPYILNHWPAAAAPQHTGVPICVRKSKTAFKMLPTLGYSLISCQISRQLPAKLQHCCTVTSLKQNSLMVLWYGMFIWMGILECVTASQTHDDNNSDAQQILKDYWSPHPSMICLLYAVVNEISLRTQSGGANLGPGKSCRRWNVL